MTGAPIFRDDIEQHSPAWYSARAGKWSSSNAATIMGGPDTKGLSDLVATLAWERVYGPANEPHYQSGAMKRGNELEGAARDWLAFNNDVVIQQCGVVEHASIPFVCWSPDGVYLPDRKRACEIKCLLHKAYMDVLFKREVPSEYRWQVRWAMWVGDLDGLDFTVFHPGPGGIVIPVERDKSFDDEMAARVHLLETTRIAPLIERLQDQAA